MVFFSDPDPIHWRSFSHVVFTTFKVCAMLAKLSRLGADPIFRVLRLRWARQCIRAIDKWQLELVSDIVHVMDLNYEYLLCLSQDAHNWLMFLDTCNVLHFAALESMQGGFSVHLHRHRPNYDLWGVWQQHGAPWHMHMVILSTSLEASGAWKGSACCVCSSDPIRLTLQCQVGVENSRSTTRALNGMEQWTPVWIGGLRLLTADNAVQASILVVHQPHIGL